MRLALAPKVAVVEGDTTVAEEDRVVADVARQLPSLRVMEHLAVDEHALLIRRHDARTGDDYHRSSGHYNHDPAQND